jgi:molybdopterin converting factor small subunit
MADRLLEPGPQLREYINVFVDGERVRDLNAALSDATVVHIIPAVAGG